eukprot:TRINITY_DN4028_c0_g1_i1.p1 TRINITY_DN4028_c0_g1~~TRINITY_DN4028_c0_g1_i1.p1  ORF type:complete len:419 (+),score=166.65 TRINITY_DN4028_c0_g1_i1:686-1942(+)
MLKGIKSKADKKKEKKNNGGYNKGKNNQVDEPGRQKVVDYNNNNGTEDELGEGIKSIAMYDYDPEQDDEIGLKKGELVIVFERDESGWWTGECNGKYGLFPGSFVQIIEDKRPKKVIPVEEPKKSKETFVITVSNPLNNSKSTIHNNNNSTQQDISSNSRKESNAKISTEETNLQNLIKERDKLSSQVQKLSSENSLLQSQLQSGKSDSVSDKQKIDQILSQLQSESSQRLQLQSLLSESQSSISTLTSRLSALQQSKSDLEQKSVHHLNQSNLEKKRLEQENEELRMKIIRLESSRDSKIGGEDFVLYSMNDEDNVEGLKKRLRKMEERNGEYEREIEKYKSSSKRIDDIELTLAKQLDTTRRELEYALNALKNRVDTDVTQKPKLPQRRSERMSVSIDKLIAHNNNNNNNTNKTAS